MGTCTTCNMEVAEEEMESHAAMHEGGEEAAPVESAEAPVESADMPADGGGEEAM